jgi:hypothetical protein
MRKSRATYNCKYLSFSVAEAYFRLRGQRPNVITNCTFRNAFHSESNYHHTITNAAEPFCRTRQLCSHSELLSILWNPKVDYLVHESLPPVSDLSQMDPVHTIPSYLFKIHFNIIHPPMYAFLVVSFRLAFPLLPN